MKTEKQKDFKMKVFYVKSLSQKEIDDEKSKIDSDLVGDRFDYIVFKIAEIFGNKVNYWYFNHAQDGWGALDNSMLGNKIYPVMAFICDSFRFNQMKVFIDDELFDLCIHIPTKWLSQDFEQELIDAKNSYEETIRKSAENRKKLQDSIYKKLTKEELGLCLKEGFKEIYNKGKQDEDKNQD